MLSFDLNEILLETDQGMLMVKGKDLHVNRLSCLLYTSFDDMMRTGQETPHHMYSLVMHTLKAVEQVRADKVLRLTMLLHDVAKPQMKTVDTRCV